MNTSIFQNKKIIPANNNNYDNYDILNPKFTINKAKEKISVTAKEGNFIDKNNVLLKDNVIFKSNNFTLESDNVIYNQKNEIANSNKKSFFKSEGIEIVSDGFKIIEGGEIIDFIGKSKLTISR